MSNKVTKNYRDLFRIGATGRGTFRYFNTMYSIALAMVALITLSSFFLVKNIIAQQKNDSKVVNVAGRQRMFSQKISKVCLEITDLKSGKEHIGELKEAFDLWSTYHYALKYREDQLGFEGDNSDDVNSMFDSLQVIYDRMQRGVTGFINGVENGNLIGLSDNRNLILQNEDAFLKQMDRIVFQYAEDARKKLERLENIEIGLLLTVFFTLFLEALLIFNPLGRTIKHVIADLIQSRANANALASELKVANETLSRTNKDITDVNFALNEATILIKTDRFGTITYVNEKYCEITKYTREELVGRRLFENLISGEESIVYEHIHDAKNCDKVWRGEVYDHAMDYTFFWLDVTLIPIISMEDELYQYLVICADITKRKATEGELKRLNEAKLKAQKDEQKIRSTSIITGQEKERKRMAQEIHDGIGQMLTALKFGIQSISTDSEKEQKRIIGLKDLLHETIKEVRRISSDLLPSVLSDFGLAPAIKELITVSQNATSIPITYHDHLDLKERLDRTVEICLYRICQESINNAIKYSQAGFIEVKLENDAEFLNLSIRDNGVGFDPKDRDLLKKGRNGLNNMKERAVLIGGKLEIESGTSGTRIFVELLL